MKLIRLSTIDERANFDNIFNDDLVIKKDSKIALLSLAMETTASELVIDNQNDEINYQVLEAEGIKTVKLDAATYDANNFRDLFDDIENKLNENTSVNQSIGGTVYNKYYGLEWKCAENTRNQVFIKYEIGGYGEYETSWVYDATKVQRIQVANRTVWRQLAGQPNNNDNDRNALFPDFLSRGCGFVRCRTNIYNATAGVPEENGYIIGLSKTDLSKQSDQDPTDAQLDYGIAVSIDAAGARKYYLVREGVYTEHAVLPNFINDANINNDFQEVIINGDKIEFNVFQNGSSNATLLSQVDYTPGEKLYPFIIFRGADANLNGLRLTPSPFSNAAPSNDGELFAPPRPSSNVVSKNYILFTDSLREFLGYRYDRNPQNGFLEVVEATFTAEEQFKLLDRADSYIVELQNLKVESYDGLKNQRKNILAIIANNNSVNKIIYEASNPIFIDLNNLTDMLLRNLKVRVVRNDYSTILMRGEATMVLLID